jgi:hypothetical protein
VSIRSLRARASFFIEITAAHDAPVPSYSLSIAPLSPSLARVGFGVYRRAARLHRQVVLGFRAHA